MDNIFNNQKLLEDIYHCGENFLIDNNISRLLTMYFFIKKGATLPTLALNLITDGRSTYRKYSEAIQGATIKFTMTNDDTRMAKVSNAECYIKRLGGETCAENYVICYDWKKHDTSEAGTYVGEFDITFPEKMKSDDGGFPKGNLKMPIREPLYIIVE